MGAAARLDVAIFTPPSGARPRPCLHCIPKLSSLSCSLASVSLNCDSPCQTTDVCTSSLPYELTSFALVPFVASDASGDLNSALRVRAY